MAHKTDKMELKEKVNQERFTEVLRQVLDAAQNGQDTELMVNGETCTIPGDAFSKAKLEVEYEIDKGEYELEFSMKWRD